MMDWTDEACDRLRLLHAERLSSSQIAERLGTSRNAVIGKVHRLGLVRKLNVRRSAGNMSERKNAAAPAKRRVLKIAPTTIYGSLGVMEVEEFEDVDIRQSIPAEDIPKHQRKQLMDLQSHHCRWPYGNVGKPDFFFCGGESLQGHSYCAFHCRISRGRNVSISDDERERRRLLGLRMVVHNNDRRRGAGL